MLEDETKFKRLNDIFAAMLEVRGTSTKSPNNEEAVVCFFLSFPV